MKWVFIILALSAATTGAVMYKPRGIRNNNPGNIRLGDPWQGMSQMQNDKSFVQFDNPLYGIRALNKVLKTYYTRYGLNTVRGIILRWAPPNENDTDAYVQTVASALGVDADQTINVNEYAPALSAAIIKHENGQQPYDVALINQGVALGWT